MDSKKKKKTELTCAFLINTLKFLSAWVLRWTKWPSFLINILQFLYLPYQHTKRGKANFLEIYWKIQNKSMPSLLESNDTFFLSLITPPIFIWFGWNKTHFVTRFWPLPMTLILWTQFLKITKMKNQKYSKKRKRRFFENVTFWIWILWFSATEIINVDNLLFKILEEIQIHFLPRGFLYLI